YDTHKLEQSIECYEKALDIYSQLNCHDSSQAIATHCSLGLTYLALGDTRNAEEQQILAEKNYIRAAECQLKNYQSGLKKQKKFQMNDIVGLKISEVDRSNTSPSILPCKIIDVSYKDESCGLQYKLATLHGKITDWFSSLDLIDL
ncbi:unnamed protein product, partial [Rotaria sordida]